MNFQRRFNFWSSRKYGKNTDADGDGIEQSFPGLQKTVQEYSVDDVDIVDETGLYYEIVPDRTILGRKKAKVRLTILVCWNDSGK